MEDLVNCVKSDDKFNMKKRAAYALNLCLVSISQIIDYADLMILEQEYEGILNNLNLENFPKDEALLSVLNKILDTVNFFRIQEGEKKLIEKEYQRKMKDAIWSAVPNIGMIAVGGNPLSIGISLATQVGMGYMNYRKQIAGLKLENERKEWELYASALEQFHGLRRELFDTAWKLADEYDFPDSYRLTERQITKYNDILMDTNLFRRLERLESIQDNFEAYPQFWYYAGHCAALISVQTDDSEIKEGYSNKAKGYFDKYFSVNGEPLLRNDEINSSCALEYIEQLDPINDKVLIESLINRAMLSAGDKNDLLQLCAMAYLRIGNYEKGAKLLRALIGESYNEKINSQLLSRIYACKYSETKNIEYKAAYYSLRNIVSNEKQLYPFDLNEANYLASRIRNIKLDYASLFEDSVSVFEKYFSDIKHLNYSDDIDEKIDIFLAELFDFFSDIPTGDFIGFKDIVIYKFKEFRKEKIFDLANISFNYVIDDAITGLIKEIIQSLNEISGSTENYMKELSEYEDNIFEMKRRLNNLFNGNETDIAEKLLKYGGKARSIVHSFIDEDIQKYNKHQELKEIAKKYKDKIIKVKDNGKSDYCFYCVGENDFNSFIRKYSIDLEELTVFAVLDDKTIKNTDAVFTNKGIIINPINKSNKKALHVIGSGAALIKQDVSISMSDEIIPYDDIKFDKDIHIRNKTWSGKNIDVNEFLHFISEIKNHLVVTGDELGNKIFELFVK